MKIRQPKALQNIELPVQIHISFEKVIALFQKYASNELKEHPLHKSAKVMLANIEQHPELTTGFSDLSLLQYSVKLCPNPLTVN